MVPMNVRRLIFSLTLVFGLSILLGAPEALEAQDEADRFRNLVQKPVAVAKLSEAGYPDWQVKRLAEALNEAELPPQDFNALVGSVPYLAGMLSSLEGAVNHVVLKKERGMTGAELVGSVRTELREQELPWRTVLPTNENYLGEAARNLLSRVKESIRDRRGFEEGEPQPAETKPGSRPSGGPGPTPSPAPTPGPGPNRPGTNQPF
jgi:hypothetical protein